MRGSEHVMGKDRQAVKMSWRRLTKGNYQFIQSTSLILDFVLPPEA
jgi:hypothetical protein